MRDVAGLADSGEGKGRETDEVLDNIDYNKLKDYIKQHTTKGQAQAVAIPGQPDEALQRFEDFFCNELKAQHEAVDLFVNMKAAEFKRKLSTYETRLNKLIVETGNDGLTIRRSERYSRLETRIMR